MNSNMRIKSHYWNLFIRDSFKSAVVTLAGVGLHEDLVTCMVAVLCTFIVRRTQLLQL